MNALLLILQETKESFEYENGKIFIDNLIICEGIEKGLFYVFDFSVGYSEQLEKSTLYSMLGL